MDEIKDLKCPICGEPTNVYMGKARKDRLCKKHGKMRNDGLIDVNADGFFFEVATGKTLNPPAEATKKVEETKGSADELTCIICGKISNGKHFCLSCYNEYKNHSVDIRITNCKETQILDKYGNLQYRCEDGRKVRSKSEKIITDFLFKYNKRAVYEKTVYYYPEEGGTIELHPDFYLPDYDLYIEHNGLDTKSYKANKAKTEEMYKSMGFQIVVTTEKDLEDIEKVLKPILKIN